MEHCEKHGEYSVFCRYCDAETIALQAARERVIETAKIWDDMATKDADSFYEAENDLMKAVKALIALESQGPAPGTTTGQTPAAPEEGEDGPSQPVPQEETE